jgi:ABC-2 type transport system ATP-binding protein
MDSIRSSDLWIANICGRRRCVQCVEDEDFRMNPVVELLEVRGLSRRYGGIEALVDVSLTIRAGEVLGLIGPNGAGKTTLFECMAGILAADSGSVVGGARPRDLLFYMPDGITPWESQPTGRALRLFGALHGRTADVCDVIAADLQLLPVYTQPVGSLSRGQRKRALIAFGLVTSRPILLLDEPFEGLDLRQARDVAAVLRSHAATGRTLFLSIHQLHDAARVCDRMVLLSGGRIVAIGTLAELRTRTGHADGTLEDVFLELT